MAVGPDEQLIEIGRAALDLESRLQEWLARDISILDPALLVIGREVDTDFGGFIDILCIDAAGDIVIVELKRDRTPREVTAQTLDYAAWVVGLSNDRVTSIADSHLDGDLESAFPGEVRQRSTRDAEQRPPTLCGRFRDRHELRADHQIPLGHARREHQRGNFPVLPDARWIGALGARLS